jgi:UDP-N-acetylmuramoyl-L-alanyl-D-glutamate--2,6-diaminopimelate ligase
MDEYRDTKKRLFTDYLKPDGIAVINVDDACGRRFVDELGDRPKVTYGIDHPADVSAKDINIRITGNHFTVHTPDGNYLRFQPYFLGRHNIYNVLGAVAVAWSCEIPLHVSKKGIEDIAAVPGRLETVPNKIGCQVVVDYCHTPDALEKCLQTLQEVPHRRILTLFGCGGDRDPLKRPLMGEIAMKYSDEVIVTNDNPRTEDPDKILRDIQEGMKQGKSKYVVIPDREKAIRTGIRKLGENDIFLIAGKGHETYQIIGREKRPFDDRNIAQKYLNEKGGGVSLWL